MLTETLVKYLAGLLDADGSSTFSFRRQRDQHEEDLYYLGLTVRLASSTAIDKLSFVESLPNLTGMGTFSRYGAHKQFKTWAVSKRSDLEMLMPRLLKHMVVKAKHWQWQFELLRECRGKLLTPAQCEEMKEASKVSRSTRSGPLKPKNHPTWAWLAGYLDGDGWYRMKCYTGRDGYPRWNISVGAVAHANDLAVLRFLERTLGGIVRGHGQSPNVFVWYRNLGAEQSSYALRALPYLAKHSRLKRDKINQMIHHHRQQRLSPLTPDEGEAIV
jgi:hypothetical protein